VAVGGRLVLKWISHCRWKRCELSWNQERRKCANRDDNRLSPSTFFPTFTPAQPIWWLLNLCFAQYRGIKTLGAKLSSLGADSVPRGKGIVTIDGRTKRPWHLIAAIVPARSTCFFSSFYSVLDGRRHAVIDFVWWASNSRKKGLLGLIYVTEDEVVINLNRMTGNTGIKREQCYASLSYR
jgi:hypothetical protein